MGCYSTSPRPGDIGRLVVVRGGNVTRSTVEERPAAVK
jgi:hypothetical protein